MLGYYVMTYGGGTYTSIAWFLDKEKAEKERDRLIMLGYWRGRPPIIQKA